MSLAAAAAVALAAAAASAATTTAGSPATRYTRSPATRDTYGARPPRSLRGTARRSELTPAQLTAPQVATLAERVAALSRAGLPPTRLWAVLATREDPYAPLAAVVARTLALGGSTAEGLRTAVAGDGPVAWIAMACAASQAAGAPLAEVLDGIATAVRAEEEARRHREAALAGPRATAAVLTWLPLAGLALGVLTGGNALAALLGTTPGHACLVAGAGLWAVGRWWMSRLLVGAAGAGSTGRAGRRWARR